MDVNRLELDLRHVHLQWFADEGEGEGEEETQDGDTDVEDEVAELKKTFNQLKKESAGKDRKVSELLEENKRLKDTTGKKKERERRKIEYDDMSAEELKREIERREEQIKSEYEQEMTEMREKYKQNESIQAVFRIAPEIKDLPPFVIKLLTLPKDADEDKLKEAMESARDDVYELVNKNRFVLDNKQKTSFRPQSGEVSSNKIPSKKEWEKMNEPDRRQWSKYASDDQLKKFQDSQYE